MVVSKNQLVEVVFEDLTHEGLGVAKVDGFPIFVVNGLPGEKAEIKIMKVQKNYAYGRVVELIESSAERVEPPCLIYKQCGGCQLQHYSYQAQLQAKEKIVRDAIERIGKISHANIHSIIGMEQPWQYRNKAQVPVGELNGRLTTGFYAKRSHKIIEMNHCKIQMNPTDHAIQIVKEILQKHGLSTYQEANHTGFLRHILVRYGQKSGELMVILVTREKYFPNQTTVVAEIVESLPNLKSLIQNINSAVTNVVLGEKSIVLWGRKVIYDAIGDIQFAVSAHSFYQVNPVQTVILYEKVLEYAQLTGKETVIDAYCGVGTISLFLANNAEKVYGIEVVEQAVQDARANAELNQITNAEFIVGEAEKILPKWLEENIHADVIVVDPPRKGCGVELLQAIIEMKPNRMVYVSCNPATLARDLRILEDGGFQTKEIQPVDLFPMTGHVECCSLLVRK